MALINVVLRVKVYKVVNKFLFVIFQKMDSDIKVYDEKKKQLLNDLPFVKNLITLQEARPNNTEILSKLNTLYNIIESTKIKK